MNIFICFTLCCSLVGLSSAQGGDDLPAIAVIQISNTGVETPLTIVDSTLVLTEDRFENSAQVRLECNSDRPVEWTYDGPQYANRFPFPTRTHRFDTYHSQEESSGEHIFSARLYASELGNNWSTGNYICRHQDDHESQRSVFLFFKIENHVLFFEPGSKEFLNQFWMTDYAAFYFVDSSSESGGMPLPIHSTQPDFESLQLYKDGEILDNDAFSYDPRAGLTINLETSQPPWGLYNLTTAVTNSMVPFVITQDFVVTPPESHIDRTDGFTSFTCQAKVPILMLFNKAPQLGGEEIATPLCLEDPNPTGEYPYRITCSLETSAFVYRAYLRCYAQADTFTVPMPQNHHLHTWYFTTSAPPSAQMRFDSVTKQHSCCTNSYYFPHVVGILCTTSTNCLFSQIQHINNEYLSTTPKYDTSEQCEVRTLATDPTYFQTYVVICSVGDSVNEVEIYSQYKDTVVKFEEGVAPPAASLQLECLGCGYESGSPAIIEFELGDIASVWCRAQSLYYSYNPSFTVTYSDGTFETSEEGLLQSSNIDGYFDYQDSVRLNSMEITGIVCHAGRSDSLNYGSVTMHTRVVPVRSTSTTTQSGGSVLATSSIVIFSVLFITILRLF